MIETPTEQEDNLWMEHDSKAMAAVASETAMPTFMDYSYVRRYYFELSDRQTNMWKYHVGWLRKGILLAVVLSVVRMQARLGLFDSCS
jgi:hypothetical protein